MAFEIIAATSLQAKDAAKIRTKGFLAIL